ncbi:hypothetical protein AVDCRST_MAG82-872, partial [uncultured Rubrobacteraceae bacterium]
WRLVRKSSRGATPSTEPYSRRQRFVSRGNARQKREKA